MDEDNNQENRTTDLQESMQKGKSLLNSAKDKGKKIWIKIFEIIFNYFKIETK